ncbi:MAG: hypothetical protein WBD47_19375, partial [Phormidesmis sp.]
AGLLVDIAKGYWAADELNKAITTAQLALQSAQDFKGESNASGFTRDSLEEIAQLGQDWQQPDLRRAALLVAQTQLTATIEEMAQDGWWFEYLADQVTRLIALDNESGLVSSEAITNGLSHLETMQEQESDPLRQLDILNSLISLYSSNNQPDLARSSFNRALALIAPLSQEIRDNKYHQLALTVDPSSELLSQLDSAKFFLKRDRLRRTLPSLRVTNIPKPRR